MNIARDLLADLAIIGATVEPSGDRLILRAGSTAIPATLVNRVRAAKADLIAMLALRKDRGLVRDEHEHASSAAIIAPGKWAERIVLLASSEPKFSEPWPPRRGRIEWQRDMLLHFCSVCGAWGSYGFGVNLRAGRMGRWFCAVHRPQRRKVT